VLGKRCQARPAREGSYLTLDQDAMYVCILIVVLLLQGYGPDECTIKDVDLRAMTSLGQSPEQSQLTYFMQSPAQTSHQNTSRLTLLELSLPVREVLSQNLPLCSQL